MSAESKAAPLLVQTESARGASASWTYANPERDCAACRKRFSESFPGTPADVKTQESTQGPADFKSAAGRSPPPPYSPPLQDDASDVWHDAKHDTKRDAKRKQEEHIPVAEASEAAETAAALAAVGQDMIARPPAPEMRPEGILAFHPTRYADSFLSWNNYVFALHSAVLQIACHRLPSWILSPYHCQACRMSTIRLEDWKPFASSCSKQLHEAPRSTIPGSLAEGRGDASLRRTRDAPAGRSHESLVAAAIRHDSRVAVPSSLEQSHAFHSEPGASCSSSSSSSPHSSSSSSSLFGASSCAAATAAAAAASGADANTVADDSADADTGAQRVGACAISVVDLRDFFALMYYRETRARFRGSVLRMARLARIFQCSSVTTFCDAACCADYSTLFASPPPRPLSAVPAFGGGDFQDSLYSSSLYDVPPPPPRASARSPDRFDEKARDEKVARLYVMAVEYRLSAFLTQCRNHLAERFHTLSSDACLYFTPDRLQSEYQNQRGAPGPFAEVSEASETSRESPRVHVFERIPALEAVHFMARVAHMKRVQAGSAY